MDTVNRYLVRLCQMDRFGGRIVQRDDHTLVVYDTPAWTEDHAQSLRSRFPECEVSVLSSSHSLSGFLVVVRRHARHGVPMGDYLRNDMPSLAAATSTRVDSACKHIQQCRVSQDHMTVLVNGDAEELIRNKYRYCVHKDELVLGIGKPWHDNEKKFQNNAYPRVLSNLGKLGDRTSDGNPNEAVKAIRYMYHNATSITRRNELLSAFRAGSATFFPPPAGAQPYFDIDTDGVTMSKLKDGIKFVHDFISVGYANTQGWAHAHNGDTMSSVMIGGLRTVMNGDFEVYCGDMIQWYWPFERDCFHQSGKRKPVVTGNENKDPAEMMAPGGVSWSETRDTNLRKNFYNREFGQVGGVEKTVALIKPYKRDDDFPRVYDWYRVFAVALSSARPREHVDIRISRQAL